MFGESEDERGAGISRRAFLAGACVTGAAAMVGGLNACAPPQDAGPGGAGGTGSGANGGAVPVSKAPSKVDKTYDADLLIVGAGGSGLACAVQDVYKRQGHPHRSPRLPGERLLASAR